MLVNSKNMLRTVGRFSVNYEGRGMCTMAQAKDVHEQKLSYMKNLDSKIDTDTKPVDWDTAKPYSKIPGPKAVPILGNLWRFFPMIGTYYNMEQITLYSLINKQFGDLVKLGGLVFKDDLILVYKPEDIQKVYRNEGVWPLRVSLDSYVYYKTKVRHDVFQGQGGILTSQGEDWYKTRSVVNSPMMQPRSAKLYVTTMNEVAQSLVNNMRDLAAKHPQGEMPEDFQTHVHKWALESISIVALNRRLGLLDEDKPNVEAEQFITDVLEMFDLLNELDVKPSLWKWISTPAYKRFIKIMDRITEFELKYMTEAFDKLQNNPSDLPPNKQSVLEKLLKRDKKIALTMSFDMLIAGIDTTTRIASAALYYLATNPVVQERLRKETMKFLPTPDSPLTSEILNEMSYLRAVIKETTRLAPIAIGNLRQSSKDLVLSGYRIPKGSNLLTTHMILCRKSEHFLEPNKFIPERWLRGDDNEYTNKDLNPWVFMPFGFGPRSCIGKRLANMELEIFLGKIIRNYNLSWPHEDMKWSMNMIYGTASPLKFNVKPVNK